MSSEEARGQLITISNLVSTPEGAEVFVACLK